MNGETGNPVARGTPRVRRRKVFYIPGYDPIHPRRYRELYRKEGAAQAEISGYDIAISPKAKGSGKYGWKVRGQMDAADVEADVEVLVWSDIVRGSMSHSIPATYIQLVRTAWIYIASGTLRRLMWLRKGPVIAALYPVGMLLLQLVLALLAGHLAGRLLSWLVSLIPLGQEGTAFAARLMAESVVYWVALLVISTLVLRFFKVRDGKLYAYYLMHDYAFSARWRGATPPDLEARMAEFAEIIGQALARD